MNFHEARHRRLGRRRSRRNSGDVTTAQSVRNAVCAHRVIPFCTAPGFVAGAGS
jgi:hypothetical protein